MASTPMTLLTRSQMHTHWHNRSSTTFSSSSLTSRSQFHSSWLIFPSELTCVSTKTSNKENTSFVQWKEKISWSRWPTSTKSTKLSKKPRECSWLSKSASTWLSGKSLATLLNLSMQPWSRPSWIKSKSSSNKRVKATDANRVSLKDWRFWSQ